MKLFEAVKDLISNFGSEIVSETRFVNLLDDLGGFKETPPASKKILRGLLTAGFGELMVTLSSGKKPGWQNELRKNVNDFILTSGYNGNIVNNLVSEIILGTSLIEEAPKSQASSREKVPPKNHKRISFKDLCTTLVADYQKALNELLTIVKDEYGFDFGYYDASARTRLYLLQSKILLLGNELGKSDLKIKNWLEEEKKKVLRAHRATLPQQKAHLNKLLTALENEFQQEMEKGYVVTIDEFGLKLASFSPEAEKALSVIEFKILKLDKRLKTNRKDWILKTRNDFLTAKGSPASEGLKILDKLKGDYKKHLQFMDYQNPEGEINLSDPKLKQLKEKIETIGQQINAGVGSWCENQNRQLKSRRTKRQKKAKKRKTILSLVVGLLIISGFSVLYAYLSSRDDDTQFEATMTEAKAAEERGDLTGALNLYNKAGTEYTAVYGRSSHKKKAQEMAMDVSAKIFNPWNDKLVKLIDDGDLIEAKKLSRTLPEDIILSENDQYYLGVINDKLNIEIENESKKWVKELADEIYRNNGAITTSGKQKLDELLSIAPDNYWLNIIKQKIK